MILVSAHKQTDPAQRPGQVVNPITPTRRVIRGTIGEMIEAIEASERRLAEERLRIVRIYHADADRLVHGSGVGS